ncbi:MAG: NADPH-dependent FMN reductase [Nannocystaceae bacterium]
MNTQSSSFQVAIISGSHRPQSESLRVSQYLAGRIDGHSDGHRSKIVDLSGNPLPLWGPEMWSDKASAYAPEWAAISATLAACDAVIVVAPEWGGMAPAGLKNLFLMCGGQELAHKPGMLIGISASRGGAYPVAELRVSSYKNTRLCYIPENILLRNVGDLLHGPLNDDSSEDERYLRTRIDYAIEVLFLYADGLRKVRKSPIIDHKTYPFGM